MSIKMACKMEQKSSRCLLQHLQLLFRQASPQRNSSEKWWKVIPACLASTRPSFQASPSLSKKKFLRPQNPSARSPPSPIKICLVSLAEVLKGNANLRSPPAEGDSTKFSHWPADYWSWLLFTYHSFILIFPLDYSYLSQSQLFLTLTDSLSQPTLICHRNVSWSQLWITPDHSFVLLLITVLYYSWSQFCITPDHSFGLLLITALDYSWSLVIG